MVEEYDDHVPSTAADSPAIKERIIGRAPADFNGLLKAASQVVIRIAILLLALLVVVGVGKELTNSNFTLEKVNVPLRFEEAGYSGTVLSNKIYYQLKHVIDEERVQDIAADYEETNRALDLNVEVVGIGVPVRSLASLLSHFFKVGDKKEIIVDITQDGDTAVLNIMIDEQMERRRIVQRAGTETLVNDLTEEAAMIILKYSDPYTLARHYLMKDAAGLHDLGNYLLARYKGQPKLEPLGYYAIAGAYLTDGRYLAMESLVLESLSLYPDDLNLHAALGTCLIYQKRYAEAREQQLKIISMLTPDTPLNRREMSYFNMSVLMEVMGEMDSARSYAAHAVSIDDGFAEGHILLASLALNRHDTIACITSLKKGLSLGFPVDELQTYTDFFNRIQNHPELDALKERFESN